jgi:hypothetical protein
MYWTTDMRSEPTPGSKVIMNISGLGEVTGLFLEGRWYITNGGFPEPTIREFISSWRYNFTGCSKNLLGWGRDESILYDNPEYRDRIRKDARDI